MGNRYKTFLASIAATVVLATTSHADEIVLTTLDQSLFLTGSFAGFSQEAYVILIDGKELRVPARLVTCDGADCIQFDVIDAAALSASDS